MHIYIYAFTVLMLMSGAHAVMRLRLLTKSQLVQMTGLHGFGFSILKQCVFGCGKSALFILCCLDVLICIFSRNWDGSNVFCPSALI